MPREPEETGVAPPIPKRVTREDFHETHLHHWQLDAGRTRRAVGLLRSHAAVTLAEAGVTPEELKTEARSVIIHSVAE